MALPLCGRPVTRPHKDLVGAPRLLSAEKLQEQRREALLGTEAPGSRTGDEGAARGSPAKTHELFQTDGDPDGRPAAPRPPQGV